MQMTAPQITLMAIAIGLSAILTARIFGRWRWAFGSYLAITLSFFLAFLAAELFSFRAGNWIIAIISFLALREYFSMADVRLQDRLGILGAYASIPFMFHFVTIDWYGMFIISIPVYSFLGISLLVALGGREKEGTVFSIGAISFGLFLFVYCMGHVSYLMYFSVWMAAMLILNVGVCDLISSVLPDRNWPIWARFLARYFLPLPMTVLLTCLLSPWTEIPVRHGLILGIMIPLLVTMGRLTGDYVEADLGVEEESLSQGRGQILDNLKSLLFTAPIVFHYIRYYLT